MGFPVVAGPEPEDVDKDGKKSLQGVIDEIGLGPAQFIVCFIAGAIWAADGAEILIIGSVTRAVAEEWELRAWQRGALVSFVYFGILLGNCLSGPFGDRLGRRLPMLASFIGIVVFSVLSASATGFLTLAAVRMLVGASFGIGQPAYSTLLSEMTPSRWRMFITSLSMSMFTLGELYAGILVWWNDPTMKNLDWRWLCIAGAIPSLVGFALCCFCLHESPSYLAANGYHESATSVVESIKSVNAAKDVTVDFRVIPVSTERSTTASLSTIYSPALLYTTITMTYSCIVLNLCYYGTLYAFPQVLTEVDMGYSPAMALIVGALWELPGYVVSCTLSMLENKKLIMWYLVITCASIIAFTVGADGNGWIAGLLLQAGYLGLKLMLCVGFAVVYQVCAVVYPTIARTTGVGTCYAGGRIGGIVAPILFEYIQDLAGWQTYFYMIAGSFILNILLMYPLELKCSTEDEDTTPLCDGQRSTA